MLPCIINALVFSGLKVSINLHFSNKKEAVGRVNLSYPKRENSSFTAKALILCA
jgi:hypothetical protein